MIQEISTIRKPAGRAKLSQALSTAIAAVGLTVFAQTGAAQATGTMDGEMDHSMHKGMDMAAMLRADNHAPVGVSGAELMMKGRWMISYSNMRMEMEGNLDGSRSISPEEIVALPNIFFGTPGQPPRLRVVPTEMTTDMHMFGIMYAPTNDITIMGMLPYLEKSMKHTTFQGPTGTTELGTFTTRASGIGDIKFSGLFGIYDNNGHRVHINAGLSLPTGSIDEKDDVLAPTGMRPELRLPYPMQLGSGTYDLLPGITYKGRDGDIGWGAQYMATLRLSENDEDYTLGDMHQLTGWTSYSWTPSSSGSLRLTIRDTDAIDGQDPEIVAPVQTANPDFQGGERIDLGLGFNYAVQQGDWQGLRFGAEFGMPLEQDLNGPQMEADWNLTVKVSYML